MNLDQKSHIPISAKLIIISLLCIFFVQSYIAINLDSVTIDEFVHLPLGLYNLYTGDFTLDPINPPLSRMISALPLLWNPPVFSPEPGTSHWLMGYQLMYDNPENYQNIFVQGRLIVTMLALMLALIVFKWTTELYDYVAGIVALILFTFSPSILTHAHLATLDMAGTLGFTASLWCTWRFLDRPNYIRAILLGFILAFSILLKLSAIILTGIVFLLILIHVFSERRQNLSCLRHWFGLLITISISALLTLNAGYGFDGTFARLSEIPFVQNGSFFSIAESYPWLRLPFPQPFIRGIDAILNGENNQEATYFLAGELSAKGWKYYHLIAFGLKTPLPVIIGGITALFLWLAGLNRGVRDYCIFIPIIAIFASNSLFNSLYIGVRHVLPVYPLLFIVISVLLAKPLVRLYKHDINIKILSSGKYKANISAALISLFFIGWFISGSLNVAPRYLEYFNEIAGGPENGHKYLIDSNLDWGQDLIRLNKFMQRNNIEKINLAYFGRVDPEIYGINYIPLNKENVHGPVAISASFLMGRPYFWLQHDRKLSWIKANQFTWLQEYKPVIRVGSMFIYNLP